MALRFLFSSAFHLLVVSAATITLDWNITWVIANPDGLQVRPVIGINGQWPLPVLNFTKGDRMIANVYNGLGNESTSIHWHGMYQNGTGHMDGAPGVTQCQIAPGASMTYDFTFEQTGTYWYHSHTRGQYPDGLRQALLIADPENPYAGQYDESRVITLSDWYHDQMPTLLAGFLSKTNPTGAEPVPKAALMNDTQNLTVAVEPGKTYLFHLVNVGAFASQYFWIEDHTMKIVEVDGIWTQGEDTDLIQISTAQRYGVLVTMKNDTSKNYAMLGSMDTDLFDTIPNSLNPNVTGWLTYNQSAENPAPAELTEFDPYDDFNLVPVDGLGLYPEADQTVTLDLTMNNLGDGANYAFFNDISYTTPTVPSLYSVLSSGADAANPLVYGTYTNAFVLNKDSIVDIVLNNDDKGKHPFHLHGHAFQVIYRSDQDAGHFDAGNHSAYPSSPMRRDTVAIRPNGNIVLRFKADNPGVWLFHCHIQWHMDAGLAVTMIEAPFDIQKRLSIPENHYQVCNASGTQTSGNAAGNTKNLLDLSGQPEQVAALPAGFTTRGIVALVFSCLAAILGMATILWYGTAPTPVTIPLSSRKCDENREKSR